MRAVHDAVYNLSPNLPLPNNPASFRRLTPPPPPCVPQKDEPPEITYCVSKTGDALNLQMLTPTQPMPRAEEVEAKFLEVLVRPLEGTGNREGPDAMCPYCHCFV